MARKRAAEGTVAHDAERASKPQPFLSVIVPQPAPGQEERARTMLAAAEARQITTAEEYERASVELMAIKAKWSEVEAQRKEVKGPLDLAVKRLQTLFRGPLDFLEKAERILKDKMSMFHEEQERLRLEEQRKADAAARVAREKLLEQARKAAERGKPEKAAELDQRAATVVAPVVYREPPPVRGISTREVWCFEVVEPDKVPDQYWSIDESKIRKVVDALKADANIAGVRVWRKTGIASGSAP